MKFTVGLASAASLAFANHLSLPGHGNIPKCDQGLYDANYALIYTDEYGDERVNYTQPCVNARTGLQYDTSNDLYELPLYELVAKSDKDEYGYNTDRTVGEDIIARREASGYFYHWVSQYDGCRDRNYTSHDDGRSWWDYQDDIDREVSNIQNALGRIWGAEECEYRKWTEFKVDHRQKLPLESTTVDWTRYLLTEDVYNLRNTSLNYAQESSYKASAKSTFEEYMGYTQEKRDYDFEARAEQCKLDSANGFLSQARGKNQTELRAWKQEIQSSSNWTAIRNEYQSTWDAWSRAVRDLEEYETFDKEKLNAQISYWVNNTILSQSNYTDIRNALPQQVTSLSDLERIREDLTTLQDSISNLEEIARNRSNEIAPDSNTYSASCKNDTWANSYIDSYIDYLDEIDQYNATEWNDIKGFTYSADEAPYRNLRDSMRSWGNGGTDDSFVSNLNGSYKAEEVAFAYQWLRDDTADSETDKFLDKKDLLREVVNELLIKKNRNITDQNNIDNKRKWEENYNNTFNKCMEDLNRNENTTYYRALDNEYQKATIAEQRYNETLGYGDWSATENRTALSSAILTASEQLKGQISEQICITSNEDSWNQRVSQLWSAYNTALADYTTAQNETYQAWKNFNIAYQDCYKEEDQSTFNFLQTNMTNYLNPLLAAERPKCDNYRSAYEEWNATYYSWVEQEDSKSSECSYLRKFTDSLDMCVSTSFRTMRTDWYQSEYNKCMTELEFIENKRSRVEKWRTTAYNEYYAACAEVRYYESEIEDVTYENYTQRIWIDEPYDYWGNLGSFNPDMNTNVQKPCLADQDAYNEYYPRINVMDESSRSQYRDCVCNQKMWRVPYWGYNNDTYVDYDDFDFSFISCPISEPSYYLPDYEPIPRESYSEELLRYYETQYKQEVKDTYDFGKKAVDSWTDYLNQVNETHLLAREIQQCTADIPDAQTECQRAEASITNLLSQQYQLYDSYWDSILTRLDALRSGNIFRKTNIDFNTNNAQLVEPITRQLQDIVSRGSTEDDQKIEDDLVGPWTGPVYFTHCTDNNGELTGFQVWYNYYDPVAGMCHGDMSTNCRRELLGYVHEIELTWDLVQNKLRGIQINQKNVNNNFFNSYSGDTIVAGKVDQTGDLRVNLTSFTDSDKFFGFETSTTNGVISNIKIISYDQEALAESLYVNSLEQQAWNEESAYWHTEVARILVNDQIGNLPMPTALANVAGVYRPEDYRIDEALIQKVLAEIDGDKAAAEAAAAAEAEAQEALANASEDQISAEQAVTLSIALDLHSDEKRDANTGAIVAVIIGTVILFGLLGYCLWMACKMQRRREMNNAGGGQRIVVNSSTAGGSGNQGKLDDIM